MPKMLPWSILLLAGSVHAQTVIVKCVDAQGRTAYTTDACPPGQLLKGAKTYPAVHDDPHVREQVRRADEQLQDRYRANQGTDRGASKSRHSDSPRDRQKQACAAAREAASAARTKDYDRKKILSLDKAAVDACFGL